MVYCSACCPGSEARGSTEMNLATRIVTAVFLCALAAGAAPAAGDQPRAVNYASSKFAFKYTVEKKISIDGEFRNFNAQVLLDEKKPESGSVRIDIDLTSIDTGSAENDTEVKRPRWFDIASYPRASFVSSRIQRTAESRFEASGKLTIKGKSRDLVVPFTVTPTAGGGLSTQGRFVIKRLEFGVGDGPWSDITQVSDEVEVRFTIVLGPQPAAKPEPRKSRS